MEDFNLDHIAQAILADLQANATNIVTGSSLSSPRAVGDAVQDYLGEIGLPTILSNYEFTLKSRRADL